MKAVDVLARAEAARDRPASHGPDIELPAYPPPRRPAAAGRPGPDRRLRATALGVGVELGSRDRAGTFLQVDRDVLAGSVGSRHRGRLEILPTLEARDVPWVAGRLWSLVAPDADKYTAAAALAPGGGYCVRVPAGERFQEPVQACLLLDESATSQVVHNVVLVEEGAAASVVTGCAVHRAAAGVHIGVSELFVGPGAALTFTMIHRWAPGVHVRPRTAVTVAEGGTFVANYVLLGEVGSLQTFPRALLAGRGARARFQNVLCGHGSSVVDAGSRVELAGDGSAAEVVSRALAGGASRLFVRGQLVALTDRCRARLECRGMLVSAGAAIAAVPELEAEGVPHAELAHEAAISPIAEEEVAYLMSRGLPRDEAVAAITRGFLDAGLPGLAGPLAAAIEEVVARTPAGGAL